VNVTAGQVATTSPPRSGSLRARLALLEGRPGTIILVLAWLGSCAFLALHLNQGWVAGDEGAFSQSATRILDGQLPHRDFTEIYTGGLAFLDAGVFAVFGQNLVWLRLPLFLVFVAYVPCVYAVSRRFVPRLPSALVALFAVAWGPVTYPAALTSWYLLFFSVFGALALLKFLETERARWLLIAGVFGGLSVTFKIVGVWFIAAVLLFLIFVEQDRRPRRADGRRGISAYGVLVAAFALLCVAVVWSLIRTHPGGAELVTFMVPVMTVVGFVVFAETSADRGSLAGRIKTVLGLALPFLVGAAVPIALLAAPYVVTGSVGDLLNGVFVLPQAKLQGIYSPPLGPRGLIVGAPLAVALVMRYFVSPPARRRIDVAGASLFAILLATSMTYPSYLVLWTSARALAPLLVVAGMAALAFVPAARTRIEMRRGAFLCLAVAAFMGLIQFPFGAPIYFCYVAPLFALSAVAAMRYARVAGGLLPVALLVTYTLFGFVWIDRGAIYFYALTPSGNPQTVVLDSDRASIRVTQRDRDVYRSVMSTLERHSPGEYIWAGPDAPELYFLTDRRNPTRSFGGRLDDQSPQGGALLENLVRHGVTAIAINHEPGFRNTLDAISARMLRLAYPNRVDFGKFEVRWRGNDARPRQTVNIG
jgi:hypothetical protein